MTSMSHNHTVRFYLKDEIKWHCGIMHCLKNSTHECSYDFINSVGRSITVRVPRCRKHTQEFRQNYSPHYIGRAGTEQ